MGTCSISNPCSVIWCNRPRSFTFFSINSIGISTAFVNLLVYSEKREGETTNKNITIISAELSNSSIIVGMDYTLERNEIMPQENRKHNLFLYLISLGCFTHYAEKIWIATKCTHPQQGTKWLMGGVWLGNNASALLAEGFKFNSLHLQLKGWTSRWGERSQ